MVLTGASIRLYKPFVKAAIVLNWSKSGELLRWCHYRNFSLFLCLEIISFLFGSIVSLAEHKKLIISLKPAF